MKASSRLQIAILVLAATVNNAHAEWDHFATGQEDGSRIHLDWKTFKVNGATRKIWILSSYPIAPLSNGLRSDLRQTEFNCKTDEYRDLAVHQFEESTPIGTPKISNTTPSNWIPISPGSLNMILRDELCKNGRRVR